MTVYSLLTPLSPAIFNAKFIISPDAGFINFMMLNLIAVPEPIAENPVNLT